MEIIDKSGLKPDKDYGQNFLLEPDICKKIVDLLEINNDKVLEIGPGIGPQEEEKWRSFWLKFSHDMYKD